MDCTPYPYRLVEVWNSIFVRLLELPVFPDTTGGVFFPFGYPGEQLNLFDELRNMPKPEADSLQSLYCVALDLQVVDRLRKAAKKLGGFDFHPVIASYKPMLTVRFPGLPNFWVLLKPLTAQTELMRAPHWAEALTPDAADFRTFAERLARVKVPEVAAPADAPAPAPKASMQPSLPLTDDAKAADADRTLRDAAANLGEPVGEGVPGPVWPEADSTEDTQTCEECEVEFIGPAVTAGEAVLCPSCAAQGEEE